MGNISNCISFMLSKATKHVSRMARERLSKYEITPTQYAVMRALFEEDGQTGAEISARLFIDSATLTGVMDRLERTGFIARKPDQKDRRVNRLHLSEKGRDLMPLLDEEMDAFNDDVDKLIGKKKGAFRDALQLISKDQ